MDLDNKNLLKKKLSNEFDFLNTSIYKYNTY